MVLEIFKKNIVNVFFYFVMSPLGKGRGYSFEQLESPSSKAVYDKFEIRPVVLKKRFFKFHQHIFTFLLLSPFRKPGAFHLNKS